MSYHLVQLNVAKFLAPMGYPSIVRFDNALDRINALVEPSDGFIWRLKNEEANDSN